MNVRELVALFFTSYCMSTWMLILFLKAPRNSDEWCWWLMWPLVWPFVMWLGR